MLNLLNTIETLSNQSSMDVLTLKANNHFSKRGLSMNLDNITKRKVSNYLSNLNVDYALQLERLINSIKGEVLKEEICIESLVNMDVHISVTVWTITNNVITRNQLTKVSNGWNRRGYFRVQNRVVKKIK